ncbi:sugar phosphate isomerase/epimerase [Draconibacterium sp. IB214405]|uniref:sugar phosphate isomerase/epimerase family protein n=1 Tax=Draconibacterium sp. IB214405 TaxID=3097352 RepID=UPI002A0D928F|nr:sugar phosphate isomerase/epimerase [Draconibacterium sp. IB214405]MDX8337779.1 sugar phosphate isomerase/epimerase [Draconibacterium sp. IB214405]
MKKSIQLLFAALVLLSFSAGVTAGNKAKSKQLGIAFYSVKGMDSDMEGSLKSVSNDGYVVAESASYNAQAGKFGEYSPTDYAALVDKYGIDLISSHVRASFDVADEAGTLAAWKKVFEDHKAAGCKYVILPSNRWDNTLEGVKAQCDLMNKIGAEANKLGMKFGYHNHSAEFEKIGTSDQILEDYLIANTDPDKVFFQMDVYWITQGGQDPVEYLKKYPKRIQVLHIKDDYVIGASGEIDYEAIFKQFYKNGHKDWFVEIEAKLTDEEKAQRAKFMEEMRKAQAEGKEFRPKPGSMPGFGAPDPAKLKVSLEAISESAVYLKNASFVK